MRTEGLRRALVPISLILTLVFSIAFTPSPVLADAVIAVPGDPPIPNVYNINQGETFLLRHRMAWDEAGKPGYYMVALYWDYTDPVGTPDNAWHFTLVSVTTYFDNNFDNVPDAGVALIDNTVSTADNGTRYSMAVSVAVGNDNDGTFNVDITLRAAGPDGTPHSPTDNHPIYYTIIQSLEAFPPAIAAPDPVTVRVAPPPPSQPTLFSPADGMKTDNNTPTFEWTNGSNADNHRLLVDNDPNFLSPEIDNTVLVPDNTFTPITALPDENYSWKVIAQNAVGENHSDIWTFIIDTTPPAAPTLVWPDNGENINDNTPNLDWDAVSEISLPVTYDVWVDNDPDFSSPIVTETEVTDDNYQVTTELDEGVYYWRVQATDNASYVGENSQRSFKVDITAPTTAPTLLEPGDGVETMNNTPTFRWTAVTDVSMPVAYELQVDDDAGFGSPEINVSDLPDNTYTPTTALVDDNYSWRVRAVDNAGNAGAWSDTWTLPVKTVVLGVEVSISPESKGGPPEETLTYEVTVTNKGNIEDTYDLAASDLGSPSWNPTVSPTSLTIAVGGSKTATLSITIPSDASLGAEHTIEVTATSQADSAVGETDSCTAQVTALWGMEVSISPDNQSGSPNENLTYTVTVKNTSTVDDDYALTVSDNENWGPSISPISLTIPRNENGTATLTVTIPENAENNAEDNITVTVASTENWDVSASASSTATAIVVVVRDVEVSISPENKDGPPGERLTYEVTVTNEGNVDDVYNLTVSDDKGWITALLKSSLEVPAGGSTTTTLNVFVHGDAAHSTEDNVTVTATSTENAEVSDNASCIAHAVIERKVEVSISPIQIKDEPGATLSYTITVTNAGNLSDIYDLTVSDSTFPSWDPTVSSPYLLIDTGESDTATLSVTIPSDAEHEEMDEIRVVAVSRADAGVSASAVCEAEVSILARVEVSVSPGSGSGDAGTSIIYTVTVRNIGLIDDTYTLRAVGREGWTLNIEPDSLTIAAGDSDNATLTVVVPPDAPVGDSMTVNVSVRSEEYPTVVETDTCRTIVTGEEKAAELEIPIPLVISVIVIAAAIIAIAYLLRARPKAGRRNVLMDVSFRAFG